MRSAHVGTVVLCPGCSTRPLGTRVSVKARITVRSGRLSAYGPITSTSVSRRPAYESTHRNAEPAGCTKPGLSLAPASCWGVWGVGLLMVYQVVCRPVGDPGALGETGGSGSFLMPHIFIRSTMRSVKSAACRSPFVLVTDFGGCFDAAETIQAASLFHATSNGTMRRTRRRARTAAPPFTLLVLGAFMVSFPLHHCRSRCARSFEVACEGHGSAASIRCACRSESRGSKT